MTQSLTEMSTTNISWGAKGGRCIGLTTLPPSRADCLEIWEAQPPGTLRACNGITLPFFNHLKSAYEVPNQIALNQTIQSQTKAFIAKSSCEIDAVLGHYAA